MMSLIQKIELLSPAKNLEYGKIAINHGADAVYIGAPAFSARASAGNSVSDIESLVSYAHLYNTKVFVTLNTLLFDNELEDSQKLINSFYNIGVDALIIQDMGLLELNLPPITLHASTQCHNADVEKIVFLEKCGFRRVVLARELSLTEIETIRLQSTIELETFVHGALCVCYSGQCSMSQIVACRSGNRGVCSQPCRSSYDLLNNDGELLKKDTHLLSLKDFNASNYLPQLITSGVCSLKIEGRLKDVNYIKNITAYYRLLLDNFFETNKEYTKASSGKTSFFFLPDPEKTFNRSYTSYFLEGRNEKVASIHTQKSTGKRVGEVCTVFQDGSFALKAGSEKIQNGDGLCFFSNTSTLEGFNVSKVIGGNIFPNKRIRLQQGIVIFRNHDLAFEKQLQGKSSQRKINVAFELCESATGFILKATDEDAVSVSVEMESTKEMALKQTNNTALIAQLKKLGDSPFYVTTVDIKFQEVYFLQASFVNRLRRKVIEELVLKRIAEFYPKDTPFDKNATPYFRAELDTSANIINQKSVDFYKRHGVTKFEYGIEKEEKKHPLLLMTTKHCIKYQLEQCPRYFMQSNAYNKPLFLSNNGRKYRLEFDCKKCCMLVYSVF